jgi:DNA adenine methylase
MKPFLKWAGGKRWLARRLRPRNEIQFERYVEPFVGSGAVFFHLEPQSAVLSDVNRNLIETYKAIQEKWTAVWEILEHHHTLHSLSYYYEIRDRYFLASAERAAQFIYLNRTCWNGLYRENQQGRFNVPKGTKSTVIFPDDNFEQVSRILAVADLTSGDFEEVIDRTCDGDLVFIDPPYTVKHNNNGFVKYNERIFSWDDQVRLSLAVRRAGARRVRIVMTNAHHESVAQLYATFAEIVPLWRQSVLSGLTAYRGGTQESLITVGMDPSDILADGEPSDCSLRPSGRADKPPSSKAAEGLVRARR